MSALLVVAEDVQLRDELVAGLMSHGFAVVPVSDGLGALDLIRNWAIDAILLEAALPKLDGISLIPLIRRITQVPIIMISARLDLEIRTAALAAGADDYRSKPFDLGELAARINSALRRPLLREVNAAHETRSPTVTGFDPDHPRRRLRYVRGKRDLPKLRLRYPAAFVKSATRSARALTRRSRR